MGSDHEKLRQEVADYLCGRFISDPKDCPKDECYKEANHVLALIAERTKDADAAACIHVDHAARMGGTWTPESVWAALHAASVLWPPRGGTNDVEEKRG